MANVIIQHGCSVNGIPDVDAILFQKGYRFCDVFLGNGEDRISDIFKKFACLVSEFFLVKGIVPVENFLKYLCVGADLNLRGSYLFKDFHARGFQGMGTSEGIHEDIAIEKMETHFLRPVLRRVYSSSHVSQFIGGVVEDSSASFNRESTASFIRLIFSSVRYFSSTASRTMAPSFLCSLAANSSRVLYCFSVKSTWTRCVYFMPE